MRNLTLKDLPPEVRARLRGQAEPQPPKPQRARRFTGSTSQGKRQKIADAFDSKLEADYEQMLRLQVAAGEIKAFVYHPFSFILDEDGTKFTPDFLVQHNDHSLTVVEIKGYQWSRDVVRFKWAKSRFPMFAWKMVARKRGQWTVVREQEVA